MNSDLNIHGINSKKDFYKIIEKANIIFDYSLNNNTDELLKEDTSNLSPLEKRLLKQFNIDSNITTFQRMTMIN